MCIHISEGILTFAKVVLLCLKYYDLITNDQQILVTVSCVAKTLQNKAAT